MRRLSCRSVPSTYRPPASTTCSCSSSTCCFAVSSASSQAASYSSGVSVGVRPRARRSSSAMKSGLPPSWMSVPRPAMLVATVTAPSRPAWATMCASRAWFFAFRTSCGMPLAGQVLRQQLGLLDARGADEHRLTGLVPLGDVLDDRLELGLLRLVDDVGAVDADHRPVRRDRDDAQLVGLGELGRLGLGGAGHPGQLLVEPEVVLQRDRGEGLVLVLDLHLLLGLDGLVHALVVAPARQHAAGELVDDEHLAVGDDVLLVAVVELLGLQRVVQVADQRGVDRLVEVLDAELVLDELDALLGDGDRALGLLDLVVQVALHQRDDPRELRVPLAGRLGGPADDQRGAGLVDEDRVDLVDDRRSGGRAGPGRPCSRPCCRAGSRSRTRCSCRR